MQKKNQKKVKQFHNYCEKEIKFWQRHDSMIQLFYNYKYVVINRTALILFGMFTHKQPIIQSNKQNKKKCKIVSQNFPKTHT